MSQQKQAPLPRQEFQEWLENAAVPVLVLQKGKHLGSVVKVPATPEIDYLFGCETFYGERISWSDRLEFCGLYDRQHQALHLLDDPLPNFVSGLTEEECVAGRVSDAQPGQRCTGLSDAGDYRCPPKKWRKDGQCHGTEGRSGTDLQNIG